MKREIILGALAALFVAVAAIYTANPLFQAASAAFGIAAGGFGFFLTRYRFVRKTTELFFVTIGWMLCMALVALTVYAAWAHGFNPSGSTALIRAIQFTGTIALLVLGIGCVFVINWLLVATIYEYFSGKQLWPSDD